MLYQNVLYNSSVKISTTNTYVSYNTVCTTFTPQIKGSLCGLNVMYHNHSSPGALQLPCCAITSQWNVVQLPIGMHIIMLQHPLVCYNNTRKPMCTNCIITLYIDIPYRLSIAGSNLLVIN